MEQQYHAWWVINPPNKPIFTPVSSPEEGAKLIIAEIQRQLQDDSIYANAFGLEVYEDNEWTEWYNDDGEDILEVINGNTGKREQRTTHRDWSIQL